jgi:hypothetical protein
MYLNNNTHIQAGWLNGTAIGFLHYDPATDESIELNEEDYYWEYNILLLIFFIKITKW